MFCLFYLILESADRIDLTTILTDRTNNSNSLSIKIMWKEPEGSNGPIVSYQLEYKKVGDQVCLNNNNNLFKIKIKHVYVFYLFK